MLIPGNSFFNSLILCLSLRRINIAFISDIIDYKSPYENIKLFMEIFQPSIYIAMFPYVFLASFPIFGIVLVTRWVLGDRRRKTPENQT